MQATSDTADKSRTVSNLSSSHLKILLTDPEGAHAFGVSERAFLQLQSESWFPKPVMLGPRTKRHIRCELEAAVVNMPRPDRPGEPQQLLRGKIEAMKRGGAK